MAAGAVAAGADGAAGQQQMGGGGGTVLLDRLTRIRLGSVALVSLLPASSLSVGFPARLPVSYCRAGKAAAELLRALGSTGLRCRRLLLDVECHAYPDFLFMREAAAAAMTRLSPLVLCTCWEHLMRAPEGLAAAHKARIKAMPYPDQLVLSPLLSYLLNSPPCIDGSWPYLGLTALTGALTFL